jgi:hypothetical protein
LLKQLQRCPSIYQIPQEAVYKLAKSLIERHLMFRLCLEQKQ